MCGHRGLWCNKDFEVKTWVQEEEEKIKVKVKSPADCQGVTIKLKKKLNLFCFINKIF